jgi:hypothetical protein
MKISQSFSCTLAVATASCTKSNSKMLLLLHGILFLVTPFPSKPHSSFKTATYISFSYMASQNTPSPVPSLPSKTNLCHLSTCLGNVRAITIFNLIVLLYFCLPYWTVSSLGNVSFLAPLCPLGYLTSMG